MKTNKLILHGENAVIPVDKMPKGESKKYSSFIIGHSETGHHHVLEATKDKKFDIVVKDGEIYFTSNYEAKVVHKKSYDIHETVKVEPGTYKVKRKLEYDPFLKVRREVWD